MSSPYDPTKASGPGPSFEPAGYRTYASPMDQPAPGPVGQQQPSAPDTPLAPASPAPPTGPDPYATGPQGAPGPYAGQGAADPYATGPYGAPDAYGAGAQRAPDPYGAPDPYAAQPATNLYGQPVDPYAQPATSPYGSYGPYGAGGYGVYSYPQHSTKSKAAAAVLAFFLGTFGAHNFYLGKKSTGLIHLGLFLGGLTLMILGAVLGVTAAENGRPDDPFFVMVLIGYLLWTVNALWAFVEFIIILVKPEYDLGR